MVFHRANFISQICLFRFYKVAVNLVINFDYNNKNLILEQNSKIRFLQG